MTMKGVAHFEGCFERRNSVQIADQNLKEKIKLKVCRLLLIAVETIRRVAKPALPNIDDALFIRYSNLNIKSIETFTFEPILITLTAFVSNVQDAALGRWEER